MCHKGKCPCKKKIDSKSKQKMGEKVIAAGGNTLGINASVRSFLLS